jgi:hypothetical protein
MARKSDRVSVCATVVGAFERTAMPHVKRGSPLHLNLHFLGAEDFECENVMNCDDFIASYRPLLEILQGHGAQSLKLSFIGPNLVGSKLSLNKMLFNMGEMVLCVEFHTCLYHEYYFIQREANAFERPDMVFMLNAGIWGYKSWLPTLDAFDSMSRDDRSAGTPISVSSQPRETEVKGVETEAKGVETEANGVETEAKGVETLFIVTSYTVEEAEDDEDTIREYFSEGDVTEIEGDNSATTEPMVNITNVSSKREPVWLWEAEISPFRCLEQVERLTKVPGREYYPNHAWQCFRFKASK